MKDAIGQKLLQIVGSSKLIGNKIDRWKDRGGMDLALLAVDGLSPRWAVFPKKREEIKEIVGLAQARGFSLIPRGNGTKIGMGFIPRSADVVISTRGLDRIIDQDCENLTITLETGVVLSDIQQRLHREGTGYFIPLDPPFMESSTLGGILAANSSGPKRLLYGTARDLVLGMKVIVSDGENGNIISCGGKTVKNVSGYDMGKLFIGSLGTLGIIIEATLRLLPLPEEEQTVLASFSKPEPAFETVREILGSQLLPCSIEVLNPRLTEEVRNRSDYLLAVGVEALREAVKRQVVDLREIAHRFHPEAEEVLSGDTQADLWRGIRDSTLRLRKSFPQSIFLKMNVPISKTAEAFALFETIAQEQGFALALSSHAGSGILQGSFLFDEPGEVGTRGPKFDQVAKTIGRMTEHAVRLGGNLIVEDAPVSVKHQVKVWGQEGSDVSIFRRIKLQLDPSSLFSPGRFVGGI